MFVAGIYILVFVGVWLFYGNKASESLIFSSTDTDNMVFDGNGLCMCIWMWKNHAWHSMETK